MREGCERCNPLRFSGLSAHILKKWSVPYSSAMWIKRAINGVSCNKSPTSHYDREIILLFSYKIVNFEIVARVTHPRRVPCLAEGPQLSRKGGVNRFSNTLSMKVALHLPSDILKQFESFPGAEPRRKSVPCIVGLTKHCSVLKRALSLSTHPRRAHVSTPWNCSAHPNWLAVWVLWTVKARPIFFHTASTWRIVLWTNCSDSSSKFLRSKLREMVSNWNLPLLYIMLLGRVIKHKPRSAPEQIAYSFFFCIFETMLCYQLKSRFHLV